MTMRMRNLLELQDEFDRAFREARAWREAPTAAPEYDPPTDIARTDDAYLVRMDLPGVAREDLRVQVEGGALTIRGHKPSGGQQGLRALRSERRGGGFSRVVALPTDADPNRVAARLRDGVLTVRVARLQPRPSGPLSVTIED
jgi:HSP20 family protein